MSESPIPTTPPDLPDEHIVDQWLKEYGAVFLITILDVQYIYRRLSRREYRLLTAIENELERTDELVNTCTLWPTGFKVKEDDPAGIPESLGEAILINSGFAGDVKKLFEDYNTKAEQDLDTQMEAVIEHVFRPAGSFEAYQNWSQDRFFDAFQRARWILKHIYKVDIATTQTSAKGPPRPRRDLSKKTQQPAGDPNLVTAQNVDEVLDRVASEGGSSGGISAAMRPMSEAQERFRKAQRQQAVHAASGKNPMER